MTPVPTKARVLELLRNPTEDILTTEEFRLACAYACGYLEAMLDFAVTDDTDPDPHLSMGAH